MTQVHGDGWRAYLAELGEAVWWNNPNARLWHVGLIAAAGLPIAVVSAIAGWGDPGGLLVVAVFGAGATCLLGAGLTRRVERRRNRT